MRFVGCRARFVRWRGGKGKGGGERGMNLLRHRGERKEGGGSAGCRGGGGNELRGVMCAGWERFVRWWGWVRIDEGGFMGRWG